MAFPRGLLGGALGVCGLAATAAAQAPAAPPDIPPMAPPAVAAADEWRPFTFTTRLEGFWMWRQTGQLEDLHETEGDSLDLTKDLDVDRDAWRGMVACEARFGSPINPIRVQASFLEFDMRGDGPTPRTNVYSNRLIPAGDFVRTTIYYTRSTLEGSLGVYGYGRSDTKDWSADVVVGTWLWTAHRVMKTQTFGDLNDKLTDPRFYVGMDFHKVLTSWCTVHLRGRAGNPIYFGGFGAAVELAYGPFGAWAAIHAGTPTFGHWEVLLHADVGGGLRVGVLWRELFDQVVDGGALMDKHNETMVRHHLTEVGVWVSVTV